MRIVIATIKSWNVDYAQKLKQKYEGKYEISIVSRKEDLTLSFLDTVKPEFVFFPHWSYKIPSEIYEKFNCVVFHMTDLPFGRGGSPLQNLIVRGFSETKLSAIKVVEEMDAGPVYRKEVLSLDGSAEEIYKRAANIIYERMIPFMLENTVEPIPQTGEIVTFARRKPAESEIMSDFSEKQIYDYIRMLDAEGYPNAFIQYGDYKLEFRNAKHENGAIEATVVIRRNTDE